jgi:tetratricopeptide (TPR) repeat protein
VPFVGEAGGVPERLEREELFAGWRLFFERLAATGPLVLLIEDAQYADDALLDFLDHLIDWVRDLPVYVLVFARPELGQIRPGFGTGRNRTMLALDPLDPVSMDALVDALVPGMPPAARAAVTGQAQGIPLFAVETVRALIDRDIVQPVEGVYRLTGDVGELAVPDSLHALLAARLDALAPDVRRLAADAAVLGTSFPAEALVAVSALNEKAVRAGLAELLRREVLLVSADPLSPERGSYRFAQDMLRQVAYRTLSRRDRKARHLAVAAHMRTAFAGDGEEVADAIAQHYLDALDALPDAPDTGEIRGQAVGMLTKAAERAERTGAPGPAAARYATAARLVPASTAQEQQAAAALWERAADAAMGDTGYAAAVEHADRARAGYQQAGQARAAAGAQATAGEALRRWGHHSEARERLTAAVEALRADPGVDTVRALEELAIVEVFAGSPSADGLSAEALILGQSIGADAEQLSGLMLTRGIHLVTSGRHAEAIAYLREAARLVTPAGGYLQLGRVLLNLSDALLATDPAGAAEAAREAAGHLRQASRRDYLPVAITNLAHALLLTGDWDAAEAELTHAVTADGLDDAEHVSCYAGWLAALRGDYRASENALELLPNLRSSEDPQDTAMVGVMEAFTAVARGRPHDAVRHARGVLASAGVIGIGHEFVRWAWSLAARYAHEPGGTAASRELFDLLDSHPAGHLPPMLRAERDLARARLAARGGDPAAGAAFAAAIGRQRSESTPYHLAHGLLDHAQHLQRETDDAAAAVAVAEARDIAARLRCGPLLDRIAALAPAEPKLKV